MEAQLTRFKASKITINQYTSGWKSPLTDLKRKLSTAVSGPVVLIGDLKELPESLDGEPNWGGQDEAKPTNGADMSSPGADNPGADDPETDSWGAHS